MTSENQIKENYSQVLDKIKTATKISSRSLDDIKVVVVTKMHTAETVRMAINSGLRELGENYAEEAEQKINEIGIINELKWHMIGHIQSRKAEIVARNFDYVHSVDSLKVADRLNQNAAKHKRELPILMECNVSGEQSKFGFSAYDLNHWPNLLPEFEKILQYSNLHIQGLMTMPPLNEDLEKSRIYFQRLWALRDFLNSNLSTRGIFKELSMGTSADYQIAVEEGSTIVRIGTAILGARNYITKN